MDAKTLRDLLRPKPPLPQGPTQPTTGTRGNLPEINDQITLAELLRYYGYA